MHLKEMIGYDRTAAANPRHDGLDTSGKTRQRVRLDLANAYHQIRLGHATVDPNIRSARGIPGQARFHQRTAVKGTAESRPVELGQRTQAIQERSPCMQ